MRSAQVLQRQFAGQSRGPRAVARPSTVAKTRPVEPKHGRSRPSDKLLPSWKRSDYAAPVVEICGQVCSIGTTSRHNPDTGMMTLMLISA